MNRNDVTELIIETKVRQGITWAQVAQRVGLSKEWVTAGCLGQMTFTAAQAAVIGEVFALPDEAVRWLQVVPYKGSLPTSVPTGSADLSLLRPGQHPDVGQVPAVQDLLIPRTDVDVNVTWATAPTASAAAWCARRVPRRPRPSPRSSRRAPRR